MTEEQESVVGEPAVDHEIARASEAFAASINRRTLCGLREPVLSLEERLRVVWERCRLLADILSTQAEAAVLDCRVPMSSDGLNVLADLCRASADDLERLAHDVPGPIANWYPEAIDMADAADQGPSRPENRSDFHLASI